MMANFREGWPKVEGSDAVQQRFGGWPGFHDAEVRRLTLDCTSPEDAPTLELVVYVFQTRPRQVDEQGLLVWHNQTLLTLRFTRLRELKIGGFNHQNQLAGLRLNDVSVRQWEWTKFEVRVLGEFGVEASFYCHEISVVAMEAFESSDQDRRGRVDRARPVLPPE